MFGICFFLGKPLLCLIFVPLLFWEFIPYGICVVPQPVLFNTRIINVLPLILYRLSFCGLILLSLVGLMVCGCNQIIQKCGCRLIGGDEFLIAWLYLYWILPPVLIYSTIRVISIYLCLIVPLQSGFRRSGWLYLNWLPCDYLVQPTGTCCTWLSLPFLKLLMLHCPWSVIMGWFCSFLSL